MKWLLPLLLATRAAALTLPAQWCAQPQFGTTRMIEATGVVQPWGVLEVRLMGTCRLMDPYYLPGPAHPTITATLSNSTGHLALVSPPIVVDNNSDGYKEPFSMVVGFTPQSRVKVNGHLDWTFGALVEQDRDPLMVWGGMNMTDPETTLVLSLDADVSSCCEFQEMNVQVQPGIPVTPLSTPFGP